MAEIRRLPVDVGSLSHYLQGFSTIPGGCLGFQPSTVGWIFMAFEVSVVVLAAAGALLEDVSFVVSLCGVARRKLRTPLVTMVKPKNEFKK